jgi:hypothetical protein
MFYDRKYVLSFLILILTKESKLMVDIFLKIIYTEFLKQIIAVVFCFIKPVLINWVRKIRKKVF